MSFQSKDVPRNRLGTTGLRNKRRRVTDVSEHKSRIHELLESGQPAFAKRKWR